MQGKDVCRLSVAITTFHRERWTAKMAGEGKSRRFEYPSGKAQHQRTAEFGSGKKPSFSDSPMTARN